jgi:hypothetical protein
VTVVAPGVTLLSRTESGLPAEAGGSTGAPQDVLRVHHGASQNVAGLSAVRDVWRAYRNLHVNTNGWSDIGYSFGVGRDGDPEKAYILTGRGWGRWGAHTLNHNDDLGVCFIGDGSNPAVLTPGVKRAYSWIRSARHDGPRPAFGHRDTSQTACPGDALYAWVKAGMPLPTTPDPEDDMPYTEAQLVNFARVAVQAELGDENVGAFSDRIVEKVLAALPPQGGCNCDADVIAAKVAINLAARLAQ